MCLIVLGLLSNVAFAIYITYRHFTLLAFYSAYFLLYLLFATEFLSKSLSPLPFCNENSIQAIFPLPFCNEISSQAIFLLPFCDGILRKTRNHQANWTEVYFNVSDRSGGLAGFSSISQNY